MSYNLDVDIIDFLDLINETLSYSFVEKWRHKYSEKFIKHFQFKILDAMNKQKPIKAEMLYNYLTKKCKYSHDQVQNFFGSVEIDIYRPFIYGSYPKSS
mgnify:FL=1